MSMEELIRRKIKDENNANARGLAVIISNDHMNGISKTTHLLGAIKDAEVMEETFKHLNFAVITIKNATKKEIKALITRVASYLHYPKTYNCFAITFSGHGSGKPMILSAHDEEVHLNIDIFQPLDSDTLMGIPKLIFIDACRVESYEDHPLSVPDNFLVAYSTRYGQMATESEESGTWMQTLAAELKTSSKSVQSVIVDVNKAVANSQQGAQQGPQLINTTVDICLAIASARKDSGAGGLQYLGHPAPIMSDFILVKNDEKHDERKLSQRISACWQKIGNVLGIEHNIIQGINNGPGHAEDHFRDIIAIWLDEASGLPNSARYPLSWEGLKTLLEDIGKCEVAKDYFSFLDNIPK